MFNPDEFEKIASNAKQLDVIDRLCEQALDDIVAYAMRDELLYRERLQYALDRIDRFGDEIKAAQATWRKTRSRVEPN
jgi:hypothetical protein